MRTVLTMYLLALSMSVSAGKLVWHKGSVVLAAGDQVITGEISLAPAREGIYFRTGESLIIYPAHKLKSFRFYDAEASINRSFVSLRDTHGVVRKHHLYEYVVPGIFSVVKSVAENLVNHNTNRGQGDFDYYIFYKNSLVGISKFRTHVFPEMLSANRDEVLSYVHGNNLDLNLPGSAIMIIKYFNTEVGYSALAANY
jgi:hypothetical protein